MKTVLPLDGITVLTLEHAIAGPFCTRQLADHGARIIKIERPGSGDFARGYDRRVLGMSSHFVWCNRSKESVALDIKHPQAAEVLEKLLGKADVLVQNLAPGAAARIGLDYESLRERFPALIFCDISGYGSAGPYRDRKAYDLLIQSESGFLSVTGTGDEPCKAGASVADISAGMYAFSSILSALILRGRTGRGCRIDISLLETMVEWMGYPLYYAFDGAPPPPRTGAEHATICPYGPYATGDGKTILLGLQNEPEWRAFCAIVLERPQLGTDPRFASNYLRVGARQEINGIISQIFAQLSAEQILARLDAAQIAYARMNGMADVWAHPQLHARGKWTTVGTPAGSIPAFVPPAMPVGCEPRMDPVPALGEHTEAVLLEIGYDDRAIARMRAAGVIGAACSGAAAK